MNPLFPTRDQRLLIEAKLTQMLADARMRVNAGSVVPSFDLAQFTEQLQAFDFAVPQPVDAMLEWSIAQLETGLVHVAHPRYFGLFNPTPSFPAECADRITAMFNPQLATATTSPAAVAIERHVITAVADRLGFPAGAGGHFTTGGSEANTTALLLALTRANPQFAQIGARAFAGTPRFYISKDSHLAWLKIAHQVGIGRDAVRLIKTDGQGRMDCLALAQTITLDQENGDVPVMIVATAGTTNAGMIDPIRLCARVAENAGQWLHVDAAWGGGLIASETISWKMLLGGIDEADSVTIDAHKWFATTMGCGMLISRWPDLLRQTFRVVNTYMPSDRPDDPYTTSLQWSRRFLGLRLFLSLAIAGWSGHGEHVDHTRKLAARLAELATTDGWHVVQSPLGVVCLLPPRPDMVRTVVARVLASGLAWVSVATFEGREVIRACVTSGETTEDDVITLVTKLHQAASEG